MAEGETGRGRGRPLVIAATAYGLGALVDGERLVDNLIAVALFIGLALVLARARRVSAILFVPFAFFFAGVVTGQLRLPPQETLSARVDLARYDEPLLLEGVVREAPEVRPDRVRLVVDLVGTATAVGRPLEPVEGRIRITTLGTAPPCGVPGDRVRVFATARPIRANDFPGGVPRRALAARRGVSLVGFSRSPDHCVRVGDGDRVDPRAAMEGVRASLHGGIDRHLSRERAAVVRAFATGDTSGLTAEENDAFVRSGLAHLLAVSGLNLAIVSGLFVIGLGVVLRRSRRIALGIGVKSASAIAAVPFVVLYTMLVGASPSAVRAALMVLALLAARILGRVTEAWSALALALIAMVAYDPTTLGDPSFQLSFASVVALLRIFPALRDVARIGRWPRWLRPPGEVFLASLAATIGTAPLVARHFNRLSIAGLLANLPAAPLSSLVLVPSSLVGGTLSLISDTIAWPVLTLAGWAAGVLSWIAETAAALPAATIVLPTPTIPEAVLFYGAIIGLTRRPLSKLSIRLGIASALLMVGSIGGSWLLRVTSDDLRATFLPVGHGDAVVLEVPGGETWLVDTGPPGYGRDAAERVVVPYLLHRRIRRIDTLVLTHADADHAGSVATLLDRVDVGSIWVNGDPRAPLEGIGDRSVVVVTSSTPPVRRGPLEVRVLSPSAVPEGYETENDASIVLRVAIGDRVLLLTGDIEADAEERLLRSGAPLRADVLKAPHHGSRTSSSEAFVGAVGAAHVVFSAGHRDRFGHPHADVVDRYRETGATLWGTGRNGAITILTDGDELAIEAFVEDAPAR